MKKDLFPVAVIGAFIGALSQPIITNLVPGPTALFRIAVFFGFFAFAPLALLVGFWLGKVWPPIYQFAKFGAVGTTNFFLDSGILNLAISLTGVSSGVAYTVFKTFSAFIATTNGFFWNKHWTFASRAPSTIREAARYYAVAFVGGAVNVAVASYIVNATLRPEGISSVLWANIGALGGIFGGLFFDFFGYKYLVFQRSGEQKLDI